MIMKKTTVYDSTGTALHQLVQYDHDVYVYLKNISFVAPCSVYFYSTKKMDESLFVNSTTIHDSELRVKIPNELLMQDGRIIGVCFIPIDGGERSIMQFEIDIIGRPKPENWEHECSDDCIHIEVSS